MKQWYYAKNFALRGAPKFCFSLKRKFLEKKAIGREDYIQERVDYYVKLAAPFDLPEDAVRIRDFTYQRPSVYYLDLKEFLYYFPDDFRFRYYFGDSTHIEPHPTIVKARPIAGDVGNSVLFKLEKHRHFKFVRDPLGPRDKADRVVFRGGVYQPHRIRFMERHWDNPICDAGQTNESAANPQWQKPYLSLREQLKYKFIMSLEGNDVASNLKWIMSSNSIAVSPRLRFETWFMEGKLEPGRHYIEVKDDYSDLDSQIDYYVRRPDESAAILNHAHDFVRLFLDRHIEDMICIRVLEKYFRLSGQC